MIVGGFHSAVNPNGQAAKIPELSAAEPSKPFTSQAQMGCDSHEAVDSSGFPSNKLSFSPPNWQFMGCACLSLTWFCAVKKCQIK